MSHNAIEDSGFSLEINKFADLSDEEFIAKHTGLIVPKHKTEKMKDWVVPQQQESTSRRLKEMPKNKNWYKEGYVT